MKHRVIHAYSRVAPDTDKRAHISGILIKVGVAYLHICRASAVDRAGGVDGKALLTADNAYIGVCLNIGAHIVLKEHLRTVTDKADRARAHSNHLRGDGVVGVNYYRITEIKSNGGVKLIVGYTVNLYVFGK